MKRVSLIVGCLLTMALAGAALADDGVQRAHRRGDRYDDDRTDRSRRDAQWIFLGQANVSGRRSHDAIAVGRRAGRFTRLYLTASGMVDIRGIEVTFGNGDTVMLDAKDGGRADSALTFDLPGRARAIESIEIVTRDGRRARGRFRRHRAEAVIQVWGELQASRYR